MKILTINSKRYLIKEQSYYSDSSVVSFVTQNHKFEDFEEHLFDTADSFTDTFNGEHDTSDFTSYLYMFIEAVDEDTHDFEVTIEDNTEKHLEKISE